MSRSSRISFLIAGILCCLSFVGYSSSANRTSDGTREREESYVALGIPFSPWYESTKTIEDGRLIRSDWQVNLLSLSSAVLLAGIGALVAWRRSRPLTNSEQADIAVP